MAEQSENVNAETNSRNRKRPEIRISMQERLRRAGCRPKRDVIGTRGRVRAEGWNLHESVIGFPDGLSARIAGILVSELESAGLVALPSGFWICRETKPNSVIDYVRYLDAGGNPAKCRFSEWLGLRQAIALSLRSYTPSIVRSGRHDEGS